MRMILIRIFIINLNANAPEEKAIPSKLMPLRHEPTSYKTLLVIVGLLFKLTIVNKRGPK